MKPLRLLTTLTFCAVLLALPLLSPTRVQAQENPNNWVDGGYAEELEAARENGSVSQSPYTARSFDTPMYRTIEHILGPVPGVTVTADVWQRNPQYAQSMLQKSAVAGIGNYIAMMYTNPPADLALWIRDTGETLGFVPKSAHAQGVGFSGLAPLLPIWKAFRNIAYLLLAIVMIVIGFMVMLRKKIDPKTVVTVQNALPRIVITLLLITFSYAIVGIMIDLMYVVILLAVALFKNSNLLPDLNGTVAWLSGIKTPEQLYSQGGLIQNVTVLEFNPYKLLLGQNWNPAIANIAFGVGGLVATIIGAASFGLTLPVGATGLGIALAFPLVSFLISLAALFLIIRLFIYFLGAYIKILVALIFGPVQILFEAMPGTNAFASWFKNLLSNILVFPVGALMFMLSAVFIKFSNDPSPVWSPPFASLGGFNAVSIFSWVAMGIMFAIPSVTNSIQEMLKAKPLIPAGPEGVAGVFAQPAGLGWQAFQFLYSRDQHQKMMTAIGNKPEGGHPNPGKK